MEKASPPVPSVDGLKSMQAEYVKIYLQLGRNVYSNWHESGSQRFGRALTLVRNTRLLARYISHWLMDVFGFAWDVYVWHSGLC